MQASFSGVYTIDSKSAGAKCLTLWGKDILTINDNRRQPNQLFQIISTDNGQVYFKCQELKTCITLKQQIQKEGLGFIDAPFDSKPTQKFRLAEVSPGTNEYLIYTYCAMVLDVKQMGKKNNTVVNQWPFHGEDNQKWIIRKA